jgi:hypothetical protein
MIKSENVSRADNQQERLRRLMLIGWIVGFVDGEGCFSIGIFMQQDREEQNRIRRGYATGYQVFHEFSVTQGEKSKSALEELQNFFQVGKLYLNKRHDNHTENLWKYVVRKRIDLINVIIPFFMENKLRTSKNLDFLKFVKCLEIINQGEHLTRAGVIKIAEIAATMNRRKSRDSIIRILRDYMPNPS